MSLHDRVLSETTGAGRFKRTGDGEYRGLIHGVPVLLGRTALGHHPVYHTYSKQPHWQAYHAVKGGKVLSDGNTTMKQAIEGAEQAIRTRRIKPPGTDEEKVAAEKFLRGE